MRDVRAEEKKKKNVPVLLFDLELAMMLQMPFTRYWILWWRKTT